MIRPGTYDIFEVQNAIRRVRGRSEGNRIVLKISAPQAILGFDDVLMGKVRICAYFSYDIRTMFHLSPIQSQSRGLQG